MPCRTGSSVQIRDPSPAGLVSRVRRLSGLLLSIAISGAAHGQSVLTYHGSADRSGNFIVPTLTWERARNTHLEQSFHPTISGHLYAQPLYWRGPRPAAGQLVVATEDNNVYAIDAGSGDEIWVRSLGRPAPLSTLPCGNIDPLGITGTPVIDEATEAIYVDAMVADAAGPHHRVFALSLKDGSPLPGWPVDVAETLAAHGQRFEPRYQNQRGALSILAGRAAVSGRRAASPATAARCSSPPATRSTSRPGATARRSFVSPRIFGVATGPKISSLQPTGTRSIRAMPISAAPTRYRWMCPRPAVGGRSSWRSARTREPTCSIATASAGWEAASPPRSWRPARSAPHPQPIRLGKGSTWHSRDRVRAARVPADRAR